MTLTTAQIDERIKRYRDALEATSANLMAFEGDSARELVHSAPLQGTTAKRIADAERVLGELWEDFGLFRRHVDRVTELRGAGRLPGNRIDELDRLLTAPAIELPPDDVPLATRGLLDPATTENSISADDLLANMVKAFDTAKRDILSIDEIWKTMLPALDNVTEHLARLDHLAADVGGAPRNALAELRSKTSAMRAKVIEDPLGLAPNALTDLQAQVRTLVDDLEAQRSQRDSLTFDLDQAAKLLADVEAAMQQGADAMAEVSAKVKAPRGLLAPLDASCLDGERQGLKPWLARLRALGESGDWRAARRGLTEWDRVARGTLASAQQVVTVNERPLRRRDELRGRLDVFHAKAAGTGRGEDTAIAPLYTRARALLWSAPVDLDEAERIVTQYGEAIGKAAR
jgi:hypothetical protein